MVYNVKYPRKDKIKAKKKVFSVFFEKYTIGKGGLQIKLTHYLAR